MLSLLFWILFGIGLLCLIVFPGKHKKSFPLSYSARNIACAAFLLIQMIFPLYGYALRPSGLSSVNALEPFGSTWVNETAQAAFITFRNIAVNLNDRRYSLPGNSVYMAVILTSVFCFFAGAALYGNRLRLRLRHKIFLLIPVLAFAITAVYTYFSRFGGRLKGHNYVSFLLIYLEDSIVVYLFGSFIMITLLYGIYRALKKITGKELFALIVILVLSFFPPFVRIVNDGMMRRGPELRYLLLGPGIPLFPLGMLVMKYKDKLLPKTKKGALIYLASWLTVGAVSFYALDGIQKLLLNQAGLRISDGYTCMPDEDFGRKTAMLEKIYKAECIPWLIFGLSLGMLILAAALYIRPGNLVTRFFRKNCYLITVLLFSRHIVYCISGDRMRFWTNTVGLPNRLLVLVPFFYFSVFAVLAAIINRILKLAGRRKILKKIHQKAE